MSGNISTSGPTQNRNKRVKSEQNDSGLQKDELGGDVQGRENENEQHGRKQNITRICRDFVRGLCRRKYCRVSLLSFVFPKLFLTKLYLAVSTRFIAGSGDILS